MKTPLRTHEKLLRKGAANLQRGIETVGGHLYLTNQRLVFEAHAVNFQSKPSEIELSDIRYTAKAWTRFLGMIPLFPNSLSVHTQQSDPFSFVLFGRKQWAVAIDQAMNGRLG
ncbi:hypothetical protein HNP46_004589 [Pseudomonas nitritireducens]|uniref:GRAM domain-containing protein n=1 Tax=Pseudomonas nitroreducens TaxID=46680 RepID=A0A7W7P296_PSENT|nr:GRAM domain-containing protein [Pseudomonas nitritireducens]MBB4865688.1 hypothetical protein [Pseudomonas nitritireducens]